MKVQNQQSLGEFVKLHNNKHLEQFRIAGNCVSSIMEQLIEIIHTKAMSSLRDIDAFVENEMEEYDCLPTFKNYHGFPNSICLSINRTLVHGANLNIDLKEGDVVKLDFGATYNDGIADSATTVLFGNVGQEKHKQLITNTKEALRLGIEAVKIGNCIGAIGNAIYKFGRDKCSVITKYGGHGISVGQVHSLPFIANRANKNEGVRITPGLTIAIEPLLCLGSDKTTVSNDGWSVECDEICAHEEHSMIILEDGSVEVFTKRKDESYG